MGESMGLWLVFFAVIAGLMIFDLGFLNRKDTIIDSRTSLGYSAFYMVLAALFGIWLWNKMGEENGMDYFTAYMIELSLSLDNLFVMSVILSYFHVPRKYQHRVLFWGIIGVLLMRGAMIAAGVVIVESFSWALYIFAAFLLLTGIKMLFMKDEDDNNIEDSSLIKFFQKHLRYTKEIDGHKFFVRLPDHITGKMAIFVTPLFMALICIEFMDVLFALDSVPAVFAITNEPFVIYSSNIFAILGLRSMYFAVAAMIERFKYMKYALAIVLIFIGGKVFYAGMIGHISPAISLGITVAVLAGGVLFSLSKTRTHHR
ncbi:MAG: TerC family protein [Alphaproteobacteria bacterium]|nr:TerC family protein [Alphaproteobacteria bacterium]MCB1550889.1 TerC family protein [Alphaproteobacteria bacterium]MCB9985603.1 TerC family protein [Micavibrio sp.]HPQ50768.1 TerC family protein [Alphaproteobacteria bacterium]HRK98255.1 TerC family protein [Alphaproteobacteria bacterium]